MLKRILKRARIKREKKLLSFARDSKVKRQHQSYKSAMIFSLFSPSTRVEYLHHIIGIPFSFYGTSTNATNKGGSYIFCVLYLYNNFLLISHLIKWLKCNKDQGSTFMMIMRSAHEMSIFIMFIAHPPKKWLYSTGELSLHLHTFQE